MKNSFLYISLLIFLVFTSHAKSNNPNQFNFNVTEIEILNNGNLIKGLKRGTINTDNGIIIKADEFIYDKITNILNAYGNIIIEDTITKKLISSEEATYFKNIEKFRLKKNILIQDKIKQTFISAQEATYFQNTENFNVKIDVYINDKIRNQNLYADEVSYSKKDETYKTIGSSRILIKNKYQINSKNITYSISKDKINSNYKTTVKDNNNQVYNLDKFQLLIENEELAGENVLVISNFGLPKSDQIYFKSGIFNLKDQKFVGKEPQIKIHKNVFDDANNDPRINGVSSKGNKDLIQINKGVFTSCSKDHDDCPPWVISADEIKHDRNKKEIIYKNALLKIYNIPILYFPKFFHPDPTVDRRSGFLKPRLNDSSIIGSSFSIPYFHVISPQKDITIMPFIYEDSMQAIHGEYRQISERSSLVVHSGFVNNYKSASNNNERSIFHLFSKFNLDLNFKNFNSSNLLAKIERVTNDTYLKLFDQNFLETNIMPASQNNLTNEIKLVLDHENYNFEVGAQSYEDLQESSSDRYDYVLPYYNYDTNLSENFFSGILTFSSNGSNQLTNTNKLESKINNDLNFTSADFVTNLGFVNNFTANFKNLNSKGKNSSELKSSADIELMSIFDFTSSLPLIKSSKYYNNYLTPKLSLKFNPSDMKNYSNSSAKITTSNLFSNNRIGQSDTFESGRSLTVGLDFRKENIENINNYFEAKLGTVLRDKKEDFIPSNSTLNRTNSNLFGSLTYKNSQHFDLKYDFSIDNNLSTIEYNDLEAKFKFNKFETTFKFIEENGEIGDSNIIENTALFNMNNANSLSFKTRRNRKLNLTEYYDLVYEYKNDCLTAGIKFKKTFYEDRELLPSEDLFFSVTLIPLTTYETEGNQLLEGN